MLIVIIPESVEKVHGFNHCTNLENVYLNGVIELDDMSFGGCDEINLHIDDFNVWYRGKYRGRDATADMGNVIGCPYNLYDGKIHVAVGNRCDDTALQKHDFGILIHHSLSLYIYCYKGGFFYARKQKW